MDGSGFDGQIDAFEDFFIANVGMKIFYDQF
jgi:hypothetical protein